MSDAQHLSFLRHIADRTHDRAEDYARQAARVDRLRSRAERNGYDLDVIYRAMVRERSMERKYRAIIRRVVKEYCS